MFIYILRQIQSTIFLIIIVLRTVVLLSPQTYHHYRYYIELNRILGAGLFSLLKKKFISVISPSGTIDEISGSTNRMKKTRPNSTCKIGLVSLTISWIRCRTVY